NEGGKRFQNLHKPFNPHFLRNESREITLGASLGGTSGGAPSSAPSVSPFFFPAAGFSTLLSESTGVSTVTTSNCRPNCTAGSRKPFTALKGITNFSGMLSKESS